MSKTSENVRERLATLVRVVFDGNSAAAAEWGGVPASTVHRIVEAKVAEPRLSTLRTLSERLGVPFSWLLGDVSSAEIQMRTRQRGDDMVLPLPEAYWLVLLVHRTRQRRARQYIAETEPQTPSAVKIKSDFSDFDFAPFTEGTTNAAIGDLMEQVEPIPDADIAIARRCAELETAVIELAAKRFKQANRRTD